LQTEITGTSSVEAGLKRLREQNRQLIMERDLLKKQRRSSQRKAAEIAVH
jgi:hypothetical protein